MHHRQMLAKGALIFGSILAPGANGQVSNFNASGSTHLIVDVAGWFPR